MAVLVLERQNAFKVPINTPPRAKRAVLASAEGGHWRELPSSGAGLQEPGASRRPSTKYERAAIDEGRTIADLCFEAVRDPKAMEGPTCT